MSVNHCKRGHSFDYHNGKQWVCNECRRLSMEQWRNRHSPFRKRTERHGHAVVGAVTVEYKAWRDAKRRCYAASPADYPYWQGRGIVMCERWRSSFVCFNNDMGKRPSGFSLDRIDVNGNYSCGKCVECHEKSWKKNCRWATSQEQQTNRRINLSATAPTTRA